MLDKDAGFCYFLIMNAKFLVPTIGLSLSLAGGSFAAETSSSGTDPAAVLRNYKNLKENRAEQLKHFDGYQSIVAGEEMGLLPRGPSADAILQKVDAGQALTPVSGAKKSERLKALQANTVLELQQSRDHTRKLIDDTRATSDLVETMPSAAHQQANSITNNLHANGEHYKWLQGREASLKAQRAGTSDPDVAAALDRAIAQVQADQVALTNATQRLISNNSAMIKRGFDNKMDNLQQQRPDINLMPDGHMKSLQNKAVALEQQLAQASNPEDAERLRQDLFQVRGEINIQRQALQRIPR
jgi:hypothetical protein